MRAEAISIGIHLRREIASARCACLAMTSSYSTPAPLARTAGAQRVISDATYLAR